MGATLISIGRTKVPLLRRWREARNLSQLELALDAKVVTVTLCETTNCGNVLGDNSLVCQPVNCDSAGTMSVTQVCSTDFKVGAVSVNICYQEDLDLNPTCTQHPGTGGGVAIGGKGFSTVVGPGSPPVGDGDTVSLRSSRTGRSGVA